MSSSSLPPAKPASVEADQQLRKMIRSHEVAIAELDSLSSSRVVYQRNHNIFFKTTQKAAAAAEQKQLDLAKAQLKKLNSV